MTTTFPQVLRAHGQSLREDIFTALAGIVESFDPATNTVNVTPVPANPIRTADGVDFEDFPTIPGVKVWNFRAGGFVCSFPIMPGDSGILLFTTLDTTGWESTGEKGRPLNVARHGLQSCVFLPGYFPDTAPLDPAQASARGTEAVIGKDGTTNQIRMATVPPEIRLGSDATDYVALAGLVTTALGVIKTALAGAADFNAFKTALNVPAFPPAVAATTVKAK